MERMRVVVVAAVVGLALAGAAEAQDRKAWGRVSFYGNGSSTSFDDGVQSSFAELIGNITFQSATGDDVTYDYRADIRLAGYPGSGDRGRRVSIYDAYAGARFGGGRFGVRAGQMWLNDLGGLGSVGGGMFEYRSRKRANGDRWRAALFGGLEPKVLDAGYVDSVFKAGGLFTYEGARMRRHVVGFVHIRDNGMTERSVISFTNFLPVNSKLFVYQAGEWDLKGPGVSGGGSLTYFFTNARYAPGKLVELQGTYHRGRSIDQRSIIRDQLDGRPVDPKALDGMRFESWTGRVTFSLTRTLRVFGGYGQDRNNRDDQVSGRVTAGLYTSNLFRTGLDVTASTNRIDRGTNGSYNSWYVSVGRQVGRAVYLSGDYTSSLSVYHFTSATGFVIDTRPTSRRVALSGVINATRAASLLVTAERVLYNDSNQWRVLSGLTYRF